MQPEKNGFLPIAALLLVQLIFGFNYAAAKVIVVSMPPILWAAVRIFIAALFMFAVAFAVVPKAQRKVDAKFLYSVFIFAIFGIALNQGFFLLGLKYTTASNSAILNTLTPVFTLLFAIVFKRERWTWVRGAGFLVAVLGVMVLRRVEDFEFSITTLQGDVYTLLNCASLAFFFAISSDFFKKNSTVWATAWMFFFAALSLSVAAIPDFVNYQPVSLNSTLVFAMLYNIVGATMITYFLNSWTLTKVSSSSVALFIYLQPVIAVLNEWATHNETPSARTILAMACIFAGVGLGVIKQKT